MVVPRKQPFIFSYVLSYNALSLSCALVAYSEGVIICQKLLSHPLQPVR